MHVFENRLSGLSEVFEMPDTPAQQIMDRYLRSFDNTIDDLLGFINDMQEADHPVVHYAAGMAALEGALRNPAFSPSSVFGGSEPGTAPPSEGPSLPLRMSLIQTAASQWEKAEALHGDFADKTLRPARRKEAFNLTLRALQAQAYRPNMEIAASWLAGEPDFFGEQEILVRRKETAMRTVRFAQEISAWRCQEGRVFDRRHKQHILTEIAAGAIAQVSGTYLILPAIMRRRAEYLRASFNDLGFLAIAAEPPYIQQKVPMMRGHMAKSGSTRQIGPESVLLRPKASVTETIGVLAAWTHDGRLDPELEALSHAMDARLNERYRKTRQSSFRGHHIKQQTGS